MQSLLTQGGMDMNVDLQGLNLGSDVTIDWSCAKWKGDVSVKYSFFGAGELKLQILYLLLLLQDN